MISPQCLMLLILSEGIVRGLRGTHAAVDGDRGWRGRNSANGRGRETLICNKELGDRSWLAPDPMVLWNERVILGCAWFDCGIRISDQSVTTVRCYPIALHLVQASIVIGDLSLFQLPALFFTPRWVSAMQKLVRHSKECHGLGSEDPCQHNGSLFSAAISVT